MINVNKKRRNICIKYKKSANIKECILIRPLLVVKNIDKLASDKQF